MTTTNTPALRFKEFDGAWEIQTLSSVALLTSSKRIHVSDYTKSGVPFFRGKEITALKEGKIPEDILYISESQYKRIKENYGAPLQNEILITAVGTLGNSYLINTDFEFYFKDGNLIWLKEITQHPKFLVFYFDAKPQKIMHSAIGSTQKALTIKNLNKIIYNFPSLEEQTKIADFLTVVDDKINELTQKHELLTEYKKGVMQQLFSQKIRFKKEDGSEFGEWEEVKIGSLCSNFKSGKTITSSMIFVQGEYPVYGGNGLRGYTNSYNHEGDYVLIGRQGALCGNVNFIAGKNYISEHAIAVQGDVNNNTKWLFYLLGRMNLNRLSESSAQAGLAVGKLVKLKVQRPSIEEQTKIADFLTELDEQISHTQTELDHAKTWKKGLLQKMFV